MPVEVSSTLRCGTLCLANCTHVGRPHAGSNEGQVVMALFEVLSFESLLESQVVSDATAAVLLRFAVGSVLPPHHFCCASWV